MTPFLDSSVLFVTFFKNADEYKLNTYMHFRSDSKLCGNLLYRQKSTHTRQNTVCGLERPLAVAIENIMPRYQVFICWWMTLVKQVILSVDCVKLLWRLNGWKTMRMEDSSVCFRSFHLLQIGKCCKFQFTTLKTPNKDVPSNTLPNVMEDEGQIEVGGLPLISRWTFHSEMRTS